VPPASRAGDLAPVCVAYAGPREACRKRAARHAIANSDAEIRKKLPGSGVAATGVDGYTTPLAETYPSPGVKGSIKTRKGSRA